MSLITQCPACSTMFRVVPDQLRISEGWVRCGQCDEVFDANAHLRSLDPAPHSDAPPSSIQAEATYAATTLMPMQAEPEPAYDWGPVLAGPTEASASGLATAEIAPVADDAAGNGTEQADAYSWRSDPVLDFRPSELPTEELAAPTPAEPEAPEQAPDSEQEAANGNSVFPETVMATLDAGELRASAAPGDDAAPSFMAQGGKPAHGRSGLGKKSLLAICSLLTLALALQVLLLERDRIAAATPALRPWLVMGCEALGCTIAPLREIESIAIDSSAFTSVRPGVYLLSVTLKNTAAVELATPALELTLTDTQDHSLMRRVLMPAELGGNKPLAGAAEWSTSLPIGVQANATLEKIAGYKLLAFYP